MSLSPLFLEVFSIVFIATTFRSAFGFGESLIAVPLLALLMPINVAVPLSVLLSVTIAGFVVVQDRKKIHFRSAGGLIFYALIGIPFGLWLLTHVNEQMVKLVLGIIIMAFSLYLISGSRLKELKTDSWLWLLSCGFLSGLLGGAYGLNGPPLVVYGSKRRWSAQHFRATLQAYFLIASLAGVIGYWISGLMIPVLFRYYLISIPAIIPAILIGRLINHRLQGDHFFRYVYFVLFGIGILLFVNSFLHP
ncbi:MAG: sulfite exporter TauE/SafE family protein [Bacteroidota bacterium]